MTTRAAAAAARIAELEQAYDHDQVRIGSQLARIAQLEADIMEDRTRTVRLSIQRVDENMNLRADLTRVEVQLANRDATIVGLHARVAELEAGGGGALVAARARIDELARLVLEREATIEENRLHLETIVQNYSNHLRELYQTRVRNQELESAMVTVRNEATALSATLAQLQRELRGDEESSATSASG